jgi:integrase
VTRRPPPPTPPTPPPKRSLLRLVTDADIPPPSHALVIAGPGPSGDALRNPVLQFLATLGSPHSRRMMMCGLRTCLTLWFKGGQHPPVETFEWWTARYEHTNLIRAALAANYKPPTANLYLAALRGVMKTCWKLRLMTWEDFGAAGSKDALPTIKGSTVAGVAVGRCLTLAEQTRLYAVCDADPAAAGRRDAALLAVLLDGGLRRAEAAELGVADVDRDRGYLIVRKGKGRKGREVQLTVNVATRAEAWATVAGRRTGPLFMAVGRTGRVGKRPLTGRPVATMLAKRAAVAKVKDVSPHDTRRTFATNLHEAGVPLERIRDLLGHASIEMTRRYLRVDAAANRAAVDTLVAYRALHSDDDDG